MPHVDEGTLHALLDGALRAEDPEQAAAVERHLAACQDCRARLDAAGELRGEASGILDQAAPAEVAPAPDFDEVLARAGARRRAGGGGGAGAGARLRRQARWTRGIAWAASLVVALGTGYLIRDLAGPTSAVIESRAVELEGEAAADASRSSTASAPGPEREPMPAAPASRGAGESAPEPVGAAASEKTLAEQRAQEFPRVQEPTDRQPQELQQRTPAQREQRRDTGGQLGASPRREALAAPAPGAESEVAASASFMDAARPATGAGGRVVRQWTVVQVSEARAVLDGPVYLLPRASLTEVYVSADTAKPRVMSRQRLESGVDVEVVQWRGQEAAAGDPAGGDVAGDPARPQGEPEPDPAADARPAMPAPEVALVVRGPYLLQVTGPLPTELLAILAGAAAPVR